MAVKAQAFAQSLVNDHFTHTPATKVDAKHAETLTKLGSAITGLGGKEAIQQGGDFSLATDTKRTTRHQIEALIRSANRTASSIAEENGTPEIMNKFRIPHGGGDEELKARANSMADAIEELGLEDEFEGHGLADFATTLQNAAQNFVVDSGTQGVAQSKQSGATQAIPGYIKSIKSAVKTLDALYHNVFDGDAETLGAWKSASHVEKTSVKNPRKPKDEPPTAPVQ
jgi:hypothetical protein